MRIDRLLCNLRFLRTRTLAARLAGAGHLRRNGVRITRASQEVAVGDVLTIPVRSGVLLIEVLGLPEKRGPARQAQACYRILDPRRESDIGAGEQTITQGDARP